MKEVIINIVFISFCFVGSGVSIASEGIPSDIHTPKDLVKWLSSEFQYRLEMPDKWQAPEETIYLKRGDCEDFAILTSEFLAGKGISSHIVVINFKGLSARHAICIWKEENGTYSFTTNRKLRRTGSYSLPSAVEKFYPDWKMITFTDRNKKHLRVIKRI